MANGMVRLNLTVRDATLSERTAVAAVTKQSYFEYKEVSDPIFWSRYEISTEKTLLEDETSARICAWDQDKLVGTVLLCPPHKAKAGDNFVDNPYPEMRLLAVLPEYRGAHVGSLLIDECERRVKEDRFDAITLHTTILMTTAKAMYERRGYSRYPNIDFRPVPEFVVLGYIKRF